VCSICSGVSEFSGKGEPWSIAAGTTSVAAVVVSLRVVMETSGTQHIPMSTLGALALYAAIVVTYQFAGALMLRHKAVLIPAAGNGS